MGKVMVMTHERIQDIIGTAIIDAEFRQHLLDDTASVIREFDLTSDEASALLSARAKTFRVFARQLNTWITRTGGIPALYL